MLYTACSDRSQAISSSTDCTESCSRYGALTQTRMAECGSCSCSAFLGSADFSPLINHPCRTEMIRIASTRGLMCAGGVLPCHIQTQSKQVPFCLLGTGFLVRCMIFQPEMQSTSPVLPCLLCRCLSQRQSRTTTTPTNRCPMRSGEHSAPSSTSFRAWIRFS